MTNFVNKGPLNNSCLALVPTRHTISQNECGTDTDFKITPKIKWQCKLQVFIIKSLWPSSKVTELSHSELGFNSQNCKYVFLKKIGLSWQNPPKFFRKSYIIFLTYITTHIFIVKLFRYQCVELYILIHRQVVVWL